MTSSDIRRKFLDFFKAKGHTEVSSDLLMPGNDPTVLFTGAGMNQFKEQFMGKNVTYTRAATCQKCIRTGDLENVGKTPRHHTFFEMLGNFSFGDYFKKEAIQWAWEFLTEELGISGGKLLVSVHTEDAEAYGIWRDHIGVHPEKIVKLGDHDNFWPADAPLKGPNGPCGPCSEIFYDRGPQKGCTDIKCGISCGCGRFVEVWNLVFTQFDRMPDGKLQPLPARNIDTGMGLERITAVVTGADSNFETDLFAPLIAKARQVTGKADNGALRIIADHARAAVFAINDGIAPSNEKRGYVVRKLIRRAWLKGGFPDGPFIYRMVPDITSMFRDVYPEMDENKEHIAAIIEGEETRFNETLKEACPILEDMISLGNGAITGEDVFKLVDTYGMPPEVIQDICQSRGVTAEMRTFQDFMEKRKEQSRRGSDISGDFIFKPDLFKDAPRQDVSGDLPLDARILLMSKNGAIAPKMGKGDRGEIVTDPASGKFYAESGGQVGDKGFISGSGGRMRVVNTLSSDGRIIHQVEVESGSFSQGDKVVVDLDLDKRERATMNHTATHLLQAALRSVLGGQVKQSGSLVDHRKLRFDFTHLKKLSQREIRAVEELVNGWIEEGISVCIEEKEITEAKAEGALSFFGEKYSDQVRVVKVGERSMELCGGTHVSNTADIRLFKIVSESSVASGIRRIEAVTGEDAEEWVREKLRMLLSSFDDNRECFCDEQAEGVFSEARNIADGRSGVDRSSLRRCEEVLFPDLISMGEKAEKAKKKNEKSRESDMFNELRAKVDDASENPRMVGSAKLISCVFSSADMTLLRKASSYAGKASPDAVVIMGSVSGDKAYIVCSVPEGLAGKGFSAREIVSYAASEIEGSGGGKDTFAQAGGKRPGGLHGAVEKAVEFIEMKQEG
jgi:alanyl-tRNA synthetase